MKTSKVRDYQIWTRKMIKYRESYVEERLSYLLLGLSGEVGELCNEFKRWYHISGEFNPTKLKDEAGDVLWYLVRFFEEMGWTVEEIAALNKKKLLKRNGK